jgi:hypothetical protein
MPVEAPVRRCPADSTQKVDGPPGTEHAATTLPRREETTVDESRNLASGAASRRAFLAGAGLTGAAVGAGVLAGPAGAAPDRRSYTGGRFALELDGAKAGVLLRGDGGNALGVVVAEAAGPDHIVHKHIGGVKYEDFTVSCGTGMSKDFYNWIKDSFDHKYARHSGRLTSWESDGTQPDARKFTDAVISEVGFPALDAASKDAAKMTIKFKPESTARGKAGPRQTIGAKQKAWLCCNFRLTIGGTNYGRVASIDSFTWKQAFAEPPPPGQAQVATLEPTKLEIPNLVITMPESHADDFFAWHEDFVLNGNAKDERSGELTFVSTDKVDLFTLTFAGLGIWVVDTSPPTVDNIRRVKVEMYCEEMSFTFTSAAWA